MSLENTNHELEYQAALTRFKRLDAKKVQEIFDFLLIEKGIFYDEFLDIQYPPSDNLVDIISSFEAALTKLGISAPKDQDEAVWVILKYHIKKIVNGTLDPLKGLSGIIDDVYWNYDFHNKTKEILGDSHGIQHLIGCYWRHDDIVGEEAVAELKKEVVQSAQEWLEVYG